MTGCEFFKDLWRRASGFSGEYLPGGMPRNDRLVSCTEDDRLVMKSRLAQKYGYSSEARLLLYAPTHRDHRIDTAQIPSDIDLSMIMKELKATQGGEWICLVRAHSGRNLNVNRGSQEAARFVDVTTYPDIADLLIASDMLVTDYSSCAGDFALTGRPLMLYQDDIQEYTTKDRPLYYDLKDTPYWVAHDMDEAIQVIRGINEQTARECDQAICDFYGVEESGNATEQVASVILDAMRKCSG